MTVCPNLHSRVIGRNTDETVQLSVRSIPYVILTLSLGIDTDGAGTVNERERNGVVK